MRGKKKKRAATTTRLRKGDQVVVIAGANKGAGPARVLRVLPETSQIVVEGINVRKKHQRRTQDNPQGGITEREFPIEISNVQIYSPELKKGVRIHVEEQDGKKVRVGSCGTVFE